MWQQFNERDVGFGYRLELKNKILKKLKELQINIVSKFWNSGRNGIRLFFLSKNHSTLRISVQTRKPTLKLVVWKNHSTTIWRYKINIRKMTIIHQSKILHVEIQDISDWLRYCNWCKILFHILGQTAFYFGITNILLYFKISYFPKLVLWCFSP